MLLDLDTPGLRNSRCAAVHSCSSSGLILGVVSLPRDSADGRADGACELPVAPANTKAHTRNANSVDPNVETAGFIDVSSSISHRVKNQPQKPRNSSHEEHEGKTHKLRDLHVFRGKSLRGLRGGFVHRHYGFAPRVLSTRLTSSPLATVSGVSPFLFLASSRAPRSASIRAT